MRVILVGELNPFGSDPRYALYHEPEHASGGRLRRILGLSVRTYAGLAKRNLCVWKWSMRAAKTAADKLVAEDWDCIVMLGARVRAAFHLTAKCPAFARYARFVSLPHPSGRNLIWNDPRTISMTREIMMNAAPHIPWGEEAV